jgi:alkyl sulfatase BDS1-like metallo-beta-lactamase superfamily hydrolase
MEVNSRATTGECGKRENRGLCKKQRDPYKYYTHDQSLRLVNQSYVGSEISEMLQLPPRLDKFWPNRGITGQSGTIRARSTVLYGVV